MAWQPNIVEVRSAHIRASRAELTREWHLAAQHYLFCLEQAQSALDSRASRYFAAKLSDAYRAMGLPAKAHYYRGLAG